MKSYRLLVILIEITMMLPFMLQAVPIVTENQAGVAQDKAYFTQDVRNTRLIFTQDNKQYAAHAAAVELIMQPLYENSFGYVMDEPLSVALMSSHNQIANGFASQFPLNRQVNYMGGAQMVDYFSASSWLDTLLLHETAHGYQVNAKDNRISSTLFKFLHNGSIGPMPLIPAVLPNLTESRFMLEGNAVLNESWHGQGGRLYSGRYRAMTYVHAKAGYLTRDRMYNETLHFPYAEGAYILGSQYQYYLAQTYGLDKTNQYFKNRSRHWLWPFQVNRPMKNTVGVTFDKSFAAWVSQMQQQAATMQLADGQVIARSKYYGELNTQLNQIVFMSNPNGVSAPLLVRYDLATGNVIQTHSSLSMGKVFAVDNQNYTVSARRTSVWRTTQGLFDDDGMIKVGSQGKVHQGQLSDGREVYFKTIESFVQPQLYVGDEFYAAVNSSVLVKNDQLYYFIQDGNERVLYQNKQPIMRMTGFYSIVKDVDSQGRIYFIANTKKGSSLFRTHNGLVERVLTADNVIDARLIDEASVVAAAISADDYYYAIEPIKAIKQNPYAVTLMWDEKLGLAEQQQQKFANLKVEPINTDTHYGLFNNLHYSRGNINFAVVTETDEQGEDASKLAYNVNFEFSDPLARSTYSVWAMNDEEYSDLLGVGFSNNQSFILAGVRGYYLVNDNYTTPEAVNTQTRDLGVAVQLRVPFLESGFWRAELASNYYQDYKLNEREPLSFQLDLSRTEIYGHSWLANKHFALSAYRVDDRGDQISGAALTLATDFPNEFYLRLNGKYSKSDSSQVNFLTRRGVELKESADFIDNDPSRFIMPSLKNDTFVEQASFTEIALAKVLNMSAYSFKGPLSLRREKIELGYRRYNLTHRNGVDNVVVNQAVASVTLDALLMNVMPFNLYVQYIYSDNNLLTESNHFQAGVGVPF